MIYLFILNFDDWKLCIDKIELNNNSNYNLNYNEEYKNKQDL